MARIIDTVGPILRQTRELSMPSFGKADEISRKSDSPHDAVTVIDGDIERFLAERLRTHYPESEFFGEEYGGSSSARYWLCDPIDGTAHYIRGLPFCTTMLALIEDGEVQFGAIYDFVTDTLYHAERGAGAYRDDEPIHVSDRPLSESYIALETHLEKPENLRRFLALNEKVSLMHVLCCGYEFARVAEGKMDARISFDPYGKDWDYAPGPLVVAEAGGVVTNVGVRDFSFGNHDLIAASPRVYAALTQGDDALFPLRTEA